jgi:hypothetical protein
LCAFPWNPTFSTLKFSNKGFALVFVACCKTDGLPVVRGERLWNIEEEEEEEGDEEEEE